MTVKATVRKKEHRKQKTYVIQRDDQLETLSVPLRQSIVDTVAAANRSCTAKEIAKMVGRSADAIYFHVAKLERVGLLVEVRSKIVAGKSVKRYTTPGRIMRIQYDLGSKTFRQRASKIANAMFRLAARDHDRCLGSDWSVCEGPSRNLWVGRTEGFVTADTIRELNQQIAKTVDLPEIKPTDEKHQRIAITISLVHFE